MGVSRTPIFYAYLYFRYILIIEVKILRYSFKDILNAAIYENTSVMFVTGKYTIFNNMVADTLKQICIDSEENVNDAILFDDEFGVGTDDKSDTALNNVDFNTFMDVNTVASINGKWFCRTDLSALSKKQKEKLNEYIKNPSDNALLVITSTDWQVFKEYNKNRTLTVSKRSHIMSLGFPNKPILKQIVKQMFESKGLIVDAAAVDLFIIRLSHAYDDYENVINNIKEIHKEGNIDAKLMKGYLKGIENYVIEDYIYELVKPLSSALTNNKKVLRMMMILEEELGAKNLVYQLIKIIDECIEYRILINNGYIPIGIRYFYNDVLKTIPNKEKYKDMQEWQFRKKANLASLTSIKDWQCMRIFLNKAIENVRVSDDVMDMKCQKALYELTTRSVLTDNRIDNILGLDNILDDEIYDIDKVLYEQCDN